MNEKPDLNTMRRLVSYDPETGSCKWKERGINDFGGKYPERDLKRFNNNMAGKECFTAFHKPTGGRQAVILGWHQLAARVVWELHYGEEPDEIIALNGNFSDLRIANLQNQSRSKIGKNVTMFSHNTSGVRGVSWDVSRNLWKSEICINGKRKSLGRFRTLQGAADARAKAEQRAGFSDYRK